MARPEVRGVEGRERLREEAVRRRVDVRVRPRGAMPGLPAARDVDTSLNVGRRDEGYDRARSRHVRGAARHGDPRPAEGPGRRRPGREPEPVRRQPVMREGDVPEREGAIRNVFKFGHVREHARRVRREAYRMRDLDHLAEDSERPPAGFALHDLPAVERRCGDAEEGTDRVDGDRRHGDPQPPLAERGSRTEHVVPGARDIDAGAIEEVFAVRGHLRRRIDGERPLVPVPRVAREAPADARGALILEDRGIEVLIERYERTSSHRGADRGVVEHDQVVPVYLLDRPVGERLQRSRLPRDPHIRSQLRVRVDCRAQTAPTALVIPRDAVEIDHPNLPTGSGSPSIPTSRRERCQRPRFDVNIVVPRNARFVGCARVCAVRSWYSVSTWPEGAIRRTRDGS